MSSMSPQEIEELGVEFTREELFQFYSPLRTNENGLSVRVCVCVCVCVCATYMVLVKGTTD